MQRAAAEVGLHSASLAPILWSSNYWIEVNNSEDEEIGVDYVCCHSIMILSSWPWHAELNPFSQIVLKVPSMAHWMFVSFQNGILTKNQIFKSHRVTSLCTAIKLSASWNVPILPLSLSMPNSKSLYNLHKWPIKMNKCIQTAWIAGHLKENLLETLWGYLSSCECTYMNRGECGWSCKAFVVQTIAISAGRDTAVSIRSSPQCWWGFFFGPLRVEKVEKKKKQYNQKV